MFREARPKLLLLGSSVALGFFYAEFSGFLVFFDRPVWVLTLSGVVAGASFLGVRFALSEPGQAIVSRTGFLPLDAAARRTELDKLSP